MSEIQFVNLLGDAIDEAIAPQPAPQPAPRPRRRRPARRYLQVALAALLVAGGTVAVAEVLSDPDQLASSNLACYEGPYADSGVAVAWAGSRSPLDFCAEVLGVEVDRLVACDTGGAVAVLKRSHARNCASAGLSPLPAGYAASQRKVARLERELLALQTSADCIPPAELARRAEDVLARLRWTGWKTVLRTDVQDGPCGAILTMGGSPRLTLSGAIDYPARELMVTGGLSLAFTRLLYGTESEPGVATWLVDLTGRRCYTEAGVRALVERELRGTGREIEIRPATTLDPNVGISGPRGRRYAEGCAILDGIEPADDFEGIVVRVLQDPR